MTTVTEARPDAAAPAVQAAEEKKKVIIATADELEAARLTEEIHAMEAKMLRDKHALRRRAIRKHQRGDACQSGMNTWLIVTRLPRITDAEARQTTTYDEEHIQMKLPVVRGWEGVRPEHLKAAPLREMREAYRVAYEGAYAMMRTQIMNAITFGYASTDDQDQSLAEMEMEPARTVDTASVRINSDYLILTGLRTSVTESTLHDLGIRLRVAMEAVFAEAGFGTGASQNAEEAIQIRPTRVGTARV